MENPANAWHAKVLAEPEIMPTKPKKAAPPPLKPSLDLDKLHSVAIGLQNKLAKLTNIAIDILISEMNICHKTPIL
jgi:hypothetical protein